MSNKEIIKEVAERHGFNLEFKAARILDNSKYKTELNKVMQVKGKNIAVDILAKSLGLNLLIESKGSSRSSILILIKAPDNIYNECSKSTSVTRININNSSYKIPLYQIDDNSPLCTFTGDFFHKKPGQNEGYNKAAKDDIKNNFYKAQQQILGAIAAYLEQPVLNPDEDENDQRIIPIILTNCDIWVVDYSKEDVLPAQYKWVVQASVVEQSILSLDSTYLPMLVVNVKYFEEVLKTFATYNIRSRMVLEIGKL